MCMACRLAGNGMMLALGLVVQLAIAQDQPTNSEMWIVVNAHSLLSRLHSVIRDAPASILCSYAQLTAIMQSCSSCADLQLLFTTRQ